jgi:hypothetical protein
VRLNKAYGVKVDPHTALFSEVSGDMLSDILPFNTPDYVLVIASKWWGVPRHTFCVSYDMKGQYKLTPTQQQYFEILRTAGAGPQLDLLLFNKYSEVANDSTSYVFVGVLGHKTTLSREAFGYWPLGGRSRNPMVNVSFELLEKDGKPYYAPIL